jgi:hypothetical protein
MRVISHLKFANPGNCSREGEGGGERMALNFFQVRFIWFIPVSLFDLTVKGEGFYL